MTCFGIANSRADLFGQPLHDFMQRAAKHLATMTLVGEGLPERDNRVELGTQRDRFGFPLAKATHQFAADSIRCWDENLPLRKQLIYAETSIDDLDRELRIGDRHFRCMTPKAYPKEVNALQSNERFGGMMGLIDDPNQIQTPFLCSVNVIFANQSLRGKLRPSTFMPAEYSIEHHSDDSQTVWLSEHEPMNRLKGMVGICLYPGCAYIELKGQLYNRTPLP